MRTFLMKNKQTINKYVSNVLFGKANSYSLEIKVFISASLITLFLAAISLIWNLYLGLPMVMNILIGIGIIVYFLLFYFARFKNRLSPLIYICTSLLFLSILYFMNGGLHGSIPPLFIIFVAISISISNSKYHILVLIVTTINLLMLIIAEIFFLEDLIIQYSNFDVRDMDLSFGYIASIVICYLLISYYKKTSTSKNEELYKINANKDLLFNIIAHDLSAPFNSILGFTEIMADESESLSLDEFQKYSEIVNKESMKANELLKSLLEWGAIQRDMVQINLQTVNLYQVTNEIVGFFDNKCTEKNIKIGIQIQREFYILADIDLLNTIIRNLVSNAIKFTPYGGAIEISTEDFDQKYITIIVKDNGIGMNKELIDNLFHQQINTNRKGTDGETTIGLGLIITKELIEKQGGVLMIESQNNQGSAFKFTVLKSNMP